MRAVWLTGTSTETGLVCNVLARVQGPRKRLASCARRSPGSSLRTRVRFPPPPPPWAAPRSSRSGRLAFLAHRPRRVVEHVRPPRRPRPPTTPGDGRRRHTAPEWAPRTRARAAAARRPPRPAAAPRSDPPAYSAARRGTGRGWRSRCRAARPSRSDSSTASTPPAAADMVRSPQPESRSGPDRCRAMVSSSSAFSRPVPSRWPMLLVRESTGPCGRRGPAPESGRARSAPELIPEPVAASSAAQLR